MKLEAFSIFYVRKRDPYDLKLLILSISGFIVAKVTKSLFYNIASFKNSFRVSNLNIKIFASKDKSFKFQVILFICQYDKW